MGGDSAEFGHKYLKEHSKTADNPGAEVSAGGSVVRLLFNFQRREERNTVPKRLRLFIGGLALVGLATPLLASSGVGAATASATASNKSTALYSSPALAGAEVASSTRSIGHTVPHATQSTPNWAGDVVEGGIYSSATTSFVVPRMVTCSPPENDSAVFWVGIDGWGNQTVEQDGVTDSCNMGVPHYYAWWETYPTNSGPLLSVRISPGDSVTASVAYQGGGTYKFEVADSTSKTSQSVIESAPNGLNSSAECIAEDPGGAGSSLVPYANYGTAQFTNCTANGHSIGALQSIAINTVNSDGRTIAATSGLTNNSAFSVTREFPAPPPPAPMPLAAPVVSMASTPSGNGYWLVNAFGEVSAHGAAQLYGSMSGHSLNAPVAHIVSTLDGLGYWLVAADGGTFAFGDAGFYGSMGGQQLNAPVVDIAPSSHGRGYWLVASDGGIFAFGDARFYGSMGGQPLNKPVVGISADDQTGGYWEVATDGGIFSFNAPFCGSTGALTLNAPIVSMSSANNGSGYWFVATDGGIFAFNDRFRGSLGGRPLGAPVVGMAGDSSTNGYWLAEEDGSVYSFGAPFYGAD